LTLMTAGELHDVAQAVAVQARPEAAALAAPSAATAPSTDSAIPAYLVEDLVRSYRLRSGDVRAIDGVTLGIAAGGVVGLLGPNGAGKTSLVRQLMGLLRPDSGRIALFGRDVVADPRVVSQLVAYLPQDDAALADLAPAAAIETTARLRGLSRAAARDARDQLIEELGLTDFARRPIGKLSGGQRRLAGVGATLAGERPVLVLDEPTAGLDPLARRAVWTAISRRRSELGTTVVLVTHNVLEAETILDTVAILDRGKVIAADTPARLKERVERVVRLELSWRDQPPLAVPVVADLAATAVQNGRRWSVRLESDQAPAILAAITGGPAFAALDDFTVATPSLEDVYLALGGAARDLERS
jgi:ABC-2 type transport system ATP-binding protein